VFKIDGKIVILDIMSLKNVLLFYNLTFPMWYFHQCCSCS